MRRKALVVLFLVVVSGVGVAATPPGSSGGGDGVPLVNWQAPPFWTPPAPVSASSAQGGIGVSAMTALPSTPLPYVAIEPCRLINTPSGTMPAGYGPPSLVAGLQSDPVSADRPFQVTLAGHCYIPPDAQAISANFTAVYYPTSGRIVAYPGDAANRPGVATLNYRTPASATGNNAIVPLSATGTMLVFASTAVDLVVDVNGYYTSAGMVNTLAATGASGLTGSVTLSAGTNVALNQSGQNIEIAASAPAGPTGDTGAVGDTGVAGPAGAVGDTGPAGVSGAAGTTGGTGATGVAGAVGLTGATGATGPNGITGPTGASGLRGLTGATGPQGASGPSGPIGASGLSGPGGPSGPQGLLGATGSSGPSGPQGSTGISGPSGPSGVIGPTGVGASGASGPSGSNGPSGPRGQSGPAGPSGSVGPSGPSGAQGATGAGATGVDGPSGAVGPSGPQGLRGATGATGLQGPAGQTGSTGAQGVQGFTGTTGAIGPTGPSGPDGPTGTFGAGVNAQSASYTAASGDNGKLIAMDGSSLTLTLPAPPPSSIWYIGVENLNASDLSIAGNGLSINGGTTDLIVGPFQLIQVWTDGSNYFTGPPLKAGANISLSSDSTGITIAAGAGTVTGSSLTLNQLILGNGGSAIKTGNLTGDVTTSGGTATTLATTALGGKTFSGAVTFSSTITGNVSGSAASFTGSLAGDVTGTQGATTIADHHVTYAKMQYETPQTLLGNYHTNLEAQSTPQEISLGSGLAFSGSTLVAVSTPVALFRPASFTGSACRALSTVLCYTTGQTTTSLTTGNYVVPTGVNYVTIEAVGGSGGGGGGDGSCTGGNGGGGGGGGAGEYAGTFLAVSPGWTIAITYGTAGRGGAGGASCSPDRADSGTDGGVTTVTYNTITYVTAHGGKGGQGGWRIPITGPDDPGVGGAGGTGSLDLDHTDGTAGSGGTTWRGGAGGSGPQPTSFLTNVGGDGGDGETSGSNDGHPGSSGRPGAVAISHRP
jgi:collagen type VII alpha